MQTKSECSPSTWCVGPVNTHNEITALGVTYDQYFQLSVPETELKPMSTEGEVYWLTAVCLADTGTQTMLPGTGPSLPLGSPFPCVVILRQVTKSCQRLPALMAPQLGTHQ